MGCNGVAKIISLDSSALRATLAPSSVATSVLTVVHTKLQLALPHPVIPNLKEKYDEICSQSFGVDGLCRGIVLCALRFWSRHNWQEDAQRWS
jgi:hypothetical protein